MVTLDDGALEAAAEYARTNKIQLSVHAMGDRAVGRIIDFFEHQTPWLEDRPSVRIEHATFLNEAQLARMNASAMRFGVTTQVIFPSTPKSKATGPCSPRRTLSASIP